MSLFGLYDLQNMGLDVIFDTLRQFGNGGDCFYLQFFWLIAMLDPQKVFGASFSDFNLQNMGLYVTFVIV